MRHALQAIREFEAQSEVVEWQRHQGSLVRIDLSARRERAPAVSGYRAEAGVGVTEPRPLIFEDGWADHVFDDAPLVETVVQAFVGRCQACGRRAERQYEGSVLTDVLAVDGTLYGDTFCAECFDEEEAEGAIFFLPPVSDGQDVRKYFEGR